MCYKYTKIQPDPPNDWKVFSYQSYAILGIGFFLSQKDPETKLVSDKYL